MEMGKPNKIKISALTLSRMERAESELRDLIRSGNGSTQARQALLALQSVLPQFEVDTSSPSGPGAA